VAIIKVIDMLRREMRRKGQKSPAGVAYNKLRMLDDTLQREREKRHIMGKAEFRRKMLRRLHQNVRLDEESRAGLQGETSAPEE
jgi:hypothetical protein